MNTKRRLFELSKICKSLEKIYLNSRYRALDPNLARNRIQNPWSQDKGRTYVKSNKALALHLFVIFSPLYLFNKFPPKKSYFFPDFCVLGVLGDEQVLFNEGGRKILNSLFFNFFSLTKLYHAPWYLLCAP